MQRTETSKGVFVLKSIPRNVLTFTVINFSTEITRSQATKIHTFAKNSHLEFYAGRLSGRPLVTQSQKHIPAVCGDLLLLQFA